MTLTYNDEHLVAPFTGAWIETGGCRLRVDETGRVAPFTGAWIETVPLTVILLMAGSRTLYGCVD